MHTTKPDQPMGPAQHADVHLRYIRKRRIREPTPSQTYAWMERTGIEPGDLRLANAVVGS